MKQENRHSFGIGRHTRPDKVWPEQTIVFVRQQAALGVPNGRIRAQLEADRDKFGLTGLQPPSIRAIFNWAKPYRPPKPRERWCLDPGSIDDALVLLPFLAQLTVETKGEICQITHGEADWILALTAIGPELSAVQRLILARFYLQLDARATSEHDRGLQADRIASDALLGFAPWRSAEAYERHRTAIDAGWVDPQPVIRFSHARGSAGLQGKAPEL